MSQSVTKEKIFLMAFGVVLGLGLLGAAYPLLGSFAGAPDPEAAKFDSIEDMRRAMLKRDDRDLKPDRSVSLRSIIHPHPSDQIMFDLLPNLDVKFQGVPVQTNSCGMRDVEREIEKPENTYRIALLGDSFAFGWGVDFDKSFAHLTGQILSTYSRGRGKVEVLNFGVPGYSTFQQVALYEERGIEFKPDAIVVYFIENDFGLPFFIRDIHNQGRFLSSYSFAKKSWAKKDDLITQQNRELLSVLDPNRALKKLAQIASSQGTKVFVAINPNKKWESVRKKLWILRRKSALLELPMREEFLQILRVRKPDLSGLSLPNDPHPSAAKHRMLAEILAAGLFPFVQDYFSSMHGDV